MKRLVILLVICFTFQMCGHDNKKSIVGKWVGTNGNGQKGGIEFLDNGTAKLLFGDYQSLPVKQYKVDYTKDPIWVDLVMEQGGQTKTYYGLLEFVDPKTIKWELYQTAGESHPVEFSGGDANIAILKKQD